MAAELAAWAFALWEYRSGWWRAANVLFAGLLIGGITVAVAEQSVAIRLAVGGTFGVAYEALNLLWLRIWTFPEERLFFFRGRVPIILGAGLPWGVIPVGTPIIAGLLLRQS